MVEIIKAKCTICGREFNGKNCVADAETHEMVETEEPIYKIGDTLINPIRHGNCRICIVDDISFSEVGHKVVYNKLYRHENVFKLPVVVSDGTRKIYKNVLLNKPDCVDLRNRLLEISINDILDEILEHEDKYMIDYVFGYKKGD